MRKILGPGVLAALSCIPLSAQSVELRSGEVVEGRVLAIVDGSVTIDDGGASHRVVALGELDPRAAYALLEARTRDDDAAALMSLAEQSRGLGLPSHAIALYTRAARLDPAVRAKAEALVASIRDEIASAVLADAREALADGRWAAAKLSAQVVADRYADTTAGREAPALVREAIARGRSETRGAAAQDAALQKAIEGAKRHEAAAARITLPPNVGFTAKERQMRESVVRHLEAAWRELARVMPADGAVGAAEFDATRTRVRDRLAAQYVAVARNLLQRRSVNQAEEWNAKACELDPVGGGCQHTQDLIVQARLTSGYGY